MLPLPAHSLARGRAVTRLPSLAGLLASLVLALAILSLPFPLNLLLVPGAILGILVLRFPASAPILLVASVPIQDAGAVSLGVQTLTATKAAVAATAIVLPLALLAQRRALRVPPPALALVLYMMAQVLSLRSARELLPGLAEIYRWGVALLAFLAVLHLVRGRAAVLWLSLVVATGAIGEAVLGMAQSFLRLGPESFAVGNLLRAYGTFGKPNPYAGYLEMTGLWLLPMAIWAFRECLASLAGWRQARLAGFTASRQARRAVLRQLGLCTWLALGSAASLLGIGLSFSRGAWLGITAGLAVLLLAASRRVQILALSLALVGIPVLLAGGGTLLPTPLRERAVQLTSQLRLFDVRDVQLTDESFAAIERMTHWQAGLEMAKASPLTGVGVGNYNVRFPEFSPHPLFRISQGHAHNYYIHAAAETGLLGLATYLLVLSAGVATAIRASKRGPTPLDRALGLGALAATTAVMVHNVVENLHVLNLSVQLAALWALAASTHVVRIDSQAASWKPSISGKDNGLRD